MVRNNFTPYLKKHRLQIVDARSLCEPCNLIRDFRNFAFDPSGIMPCNTKSIRT